MSTPLRGVYLITPDQEDTHRLLERTADALSAGVALLQYRNKRANAALRHAQAEALAALCRSLRVPLIINDDAGLAARLGADGVHLGGDDGSVGSARSALGPRALVGASCYASLERADRARADGASYIAFGAFGASPTKPDAVRAGADLLTRAKIFGIPIVAIGGITPALAPALVAAGADLLAVITTVYDAEDPAAAVHALRQAFPEFQGDSHEHQPRAV